MPIGSLGPSRRRRSNAPRPRVLVLAAVTAVTLVGLFVASRHTGGGSAPTAAKVESKVTTRHATTTAATATTLYDVSIDPNWPAKGVSFYSDSADTKSVGDQLGDQTSTSSGVSVSPSSTIAGSRRSTTTVRGVPTTLRTTLPVHVTTTTRHEPTPTAPPATEPAPTTTEAPPTTAPAAPTQ